MLLYEQKKNCIYSKTLSVHHMQCSGILYWAIGPQIVLIVMCVIVYTDHSTYVLCSEPRMEWSCTVQHRWALLEVPWYVAHFLLNFWFLYIHKPSTVTTFLLLSHNCYMMHAGTRVARLLGKHCFWMCLWIS